MKGCDSSHPFAFSGVSLAFLPGAPAHPVCPRFLMKYNGTVLSAHEMATYLDAFGKHAKYPLWTESSTVYPSLMQ